MEGKAIDDILAERDAAERHLLVEEELLRRKKTNPTSIKEDFETNSMHSERIDNIMSSKFSDPKAMKTAGTSLKNQTDTLQKSGDNVSSKINPDFYRQAEVSKRQQ